MKYSRLLFIAVYPLLCLLGGCIQRAHAQNLVVDPYRFATTQNYFPTDAGIALRWVASDLNASPVSAWTDRIVGSVMVQATGGNQPTWDASNGVKFDGVDDFLTITNFTPLSFHSVLIVSKFTNPANFQAVIGNLSGGQLYFGVGTANYLYGASGGDIGPITANRFDLFSCLVNTNGGNMGRAFTNGLIAWTGGTDAPFNGNTPWPRLGRGNGNFPFAGSVQEIIVWTNYVWTPQQITNVHRYVTNTYGVTP